MANPEGNIPWRPFRLDELEAQRRLLALKGAKQGLDVRKAFAEDSARAEDLCWELPGLLVDASKQRWDSEVVDALCELAKEADLVGATKDLFGGVRLNATEHRAVLHMAMRGDAQDQFAVDGQDVMLEVLDVRKRMLAFVDEILQDGAHHRCGEHRHRRVRLGASHGGEGTEKVSSGTGVPFCEQRRRGARRVGVVELESSNHLGGRGEQNVHHPRNDGERSHCQGMVGRGRGGANTAHGRSEHQPASHHSLRGVSEQDFWIRRLGWRSLLDVGPVGLSIALSIGSDAFLEFLDGARSVDKHVQEAPVEANIPMQLALLGHWNQQILGFGSHAVIPYAEDLGRLPAYLQQADMESNGKSVGRDGLPVAWSTGTVVWGEAGTNSQHAFFQLLHQGTEIHPVDFVAFVEPTSDHAGMHQMLLSNALAQAKALLMGRQAAPDDPHRHFEGNRPSTFFLVDALSPRALGQLVALHEHRFSIKECCGASIR